MKHTRLILLSRILAGCWLCFGVSAFAADIHAVVKDAAGKPISDAVVLAFPVKGSVTALAAAKNGNGVVAQVGGEFLPKVTPIKVGTTVSFPNKDTTRHHVYSFSPAKKFELPLYAGTTAAPVMFDKPGVVTLGCNIHDWMVGYIYVAETPYFGKTDAQGKAGINGLPAGDYTVKVWHPRMTGTEESTAQRIHTATDTAADKETVWTIKLKPEFNIRRPPAGQPGY